MRRMIDLAVIVLMGGFVTVRNATWAPTLVSAEAEVQVPASTAANLTTAAATRPAQT